jgi:hypothetical protein
MHDLVILLPQWTAGKGGEFGSKIEGKGSDILEFEGSLGVFQFPVPEMVACVCQDWSNVEDVRHGNPRHSQGFRDMLSDLTEKRRGHQLGVSVH